MGSLAPGAGSRGVVKPGSDPLLDLGQQQRQVVSGFLWSLLVLLLLSIAIEAVTTGAPFLEPAVVAANLVVVLFVLGTIFLNRHGRTRLAVSLAAGLVMVAASVLPLAGGLRSAPASLLLFFVPVVVAGLLLDRTALRVAAAWALAVVLAAPLLHGEPMFASDGSAGAWALAGPFTMVLVAIVFLLDRFGLRFKEAMRRALALQVEAQDVILAEKGFTDAMIESLPGLFFVRDENGRYVRWNRRFSEVTGYDEDELPGLDPLALYEGEHRQVVEDRIARVFTEGSASAEVQVRTKDGRLLPYFISATRVERQGERFLVGTGIDRSDIDAARADIAGLNVALGERVARLTALREIDRAIIGSLDIDLTLDVMLEQVTGRLGVGAARILLYDEAEQALRFGASRGLPTAGARGLRVGLGEGPSGAVARDRRRAVVTDRDVIAAHLAATGGGAATYSAYVGVPLVAKGRLQGVLEVFHDAPVPDADDWHDFLDALAMQAAIGVSNARLFEELERSNVELRLAYDTTIEGWARALDLRDEETEGHSRRVTELAVQLAARLGLKGEELVLVRRGALLHDIGKMGVPDRILLKPGKLDPDEWEVMKSHTTLARDMLHGIPFLRSALDIPYAHHERWDGTGYPRGLRGEEIPLAARLFAVVDVYDALTSDRPYRAAWPRARALEYIRDSAGSHFDPRVVDVFLEMLEEREAVRSTSPGRDVPRRTARERRSGTKGRGDAEGD